MSHEIQADANTSVGYNFLTKEYFVKNLGTTTTLFTASDAKQILNIASPFNNVSETDIEKLSVTYEPLTKIYYAWEDTGSYIKAIYFNDYKNHAIVYNEPFIYIKSSNEMWDISSSVSKDTIRDFFWSYFTYNLGMDIPMNIMDTIINYYVKLQQPYAYNNIIPREKPEDTLMYNNTITLNNHNKTSRGEYNAVKNPDDVYLMETYDVVRTGQTVGPITYPVYSMIESGSSILLDSVYSEGLTTGAKITVLGTEVNDNTYTIKSVGTRNLASGKQVTEIKTSEIFKYDFISDTYKTAIIKLTTTKTITENSITVTTEPQVDVGELVQLRGATNVDNLVVLRTEGSRIILNSSTPVGVHTETGNKLYASAYKVLRIGNDSYTEVTGTMGINKITNNLVYPSGWLYADNFTVGQSIYINFGLGLLKGPFKITAVTPSTMNGTAVVNGYITLDSNPGNYVSTVGREPAAIEVRNTTTVEENSITVSKYPNLNSGDVINIKNSASWDGEYIVDYIETVADGTKIWIRKDDNFNGFKELYIDSDQTKKAIVQVRKYSERILLDMTYSKWANKMPMGKFMLDNDQQLTKYLENYFITPPTSINYAEINQPVPMSYFLGEGLAVSIMNCVGTYSEVFEN